MRTFILQSSNEQDLELLLIMASRLGVVCKEIEKSSQVNFLNEIDNINNETENFENEDEESNFLLDGLGLEKTVIPILYDDLEKETLHSPHSPNLEKAISYFGSLEDDENETLEELLKLLD